VYCWNPPYSLGLNDKDEWIMKAVEDYKKNQVREETKEQKP
jgi:hypothetical protein